MDFIYCLYSYSVSDFLKMTSITKKNRIISEKYIQAGLYLASNDNNKSKQLFEEIILSKNNFYSPLALNVLLEKSLEKDNNKIYGPFKIVEK